MLYKNIPLLNYAPKEDPTFILGGNIDQINQKIS